MGSLVMNIKRWFRKAILGKIETRCPKCDEIRWFKWVKDHVYHPEEPPMFGHWVCDTCTWNSPIEPTKLTTKVMLEKYGTTFEEFAKKHILKDKGIQNDL